jgi:REP-associated tyrosine transposase
MPDHAHVIFTVLINSRKAEFYSLAEVMGRIKGASAQLINRELDRQGRVWQTESFDHVLRCSESGDAKIVYILENPVRAGLVPERTKYQWTWVRRDSANSAGPRPGGTAQGAVAT